MESDKGYTFFFKNIFLLIATIAGLVALVAWLNPNGVTINDVPRKLEPSEYGLIITMICIFLPLHIFTTNYFVRVNLQDHQLHILDGSELIESDWSEVQCVKKIPAVVPPLYKLRLKSKKRLFLFTTRPVYLHFDFGSVDASEMGQIIKEKKKQYDI